MDSQSFLTLLSLVALILLGAYFAAVETAYAALSRVRIKVMAENGSKRAALVLTLYDNYDKLLSTMLIGANITSLSAATISAAFFIRHFGDIGATLSLIIITVLVLLFGDITPKSLAKENPEKVALFAAPSVRFFIFLCTPFSMFFYKWRKLLSAISKAAPDDRAITEEELLSMVEEAEQDGTINEEDKQLIHNAIEFNDLKAIDVITPRVDISAIDKDSTPEELKEELSELFLTTGFSRIPVYEESIDNIIGVVHLRDYFSYTVKKDMPLEDIISPVVHVAPSIRINDLMKLFQRKKSLFAVVADEYGGTEGIVTMEDILEQLVGDIWDESDDIIEEFIPLGENKFRVICSADIDKMMEFFKLDDLGDEVDASTVSGWIMDMLGKIPEEGDTFAYENLRITVHRTEQRRVLDCIVSVE